MAEPRLFVSLKEWPTCLRLRGSQHHYLAHVLRLSPGAPVVILDGQGSQAAARVQQVRFDETELSIEKPTPVVQHTPRIVLLCALLKGEKPDFVVQKATELGSSEIQFFCCERSVPKLADGRGEKKQQRWTSIATHAAQQCGRGDVPTIHDVRPLVSALAVAQGQRLLFFEGLAPHLAQHFQRQGVPCTATVLVGPEGGLAPTELLQAEQAGFCKVSLGPLILRAETAVVAALATVGFAQQSRGTDDQTL